MKQIFAKTEGKFSFKHVCEVGVYQPHTSNVIDFIKKGVLTTLVEADPDTASLIKKTFNNYNIRLFPVAVYDRKGKIRLQKASASSFISEIKNSPAIVNDKYQSNKDNSIEVDCLPFSDIDDGTIDLLSIDIEGAEWYVLKYLKSRPTVISVETHGKLYTNPFIQEITKWMTDNQYEIWYKDKSDTVYVLKGSIPISISDKLQVRKIDAYLIWKKIKGRIKKVFSN